MAQKTSERVKEMKKDFMRLRESDTTIKEIANMYGITERTVYLHLEEIAKENNVSREDLLFRIHKQHFMENLKTMKEKEKINIEELKQDFSKMLETADEITRKIETTIKKDCEEKTEWI